MHGGRARSVVQRAASTPAVALDRLDADTLDLRVAAVHQAAVHVAYGEPEDGVGDAAEIADQAEQFLKTEPLVAYYDEVALNGLLMAQDDFSRGVLDEAGQTKIRETVEEVIENLSDHVDEAPEAPVPAARRPYGDLGTGAPPPLRSLTENVPLSKALAGTSWLSISMVIFSRLLALGSPAS